MKLVEVAKVGDYVDYDALISEEKSYEGIPREHMNWRVLKNDGENVILISEKPTQSRIALEGAEGYLEGPNKLDTISDKLYSSAFGKARNLKVEDVNEILGYKVDKVKCYGKNVPYGTKISELEKKFDKKLIYRETPDGKNIGEYCQTYYWYDGKVYKNRNSIEYKLVFGNSDEYRYCLSSSCVFAYFFNDYARFDVRSVNRGRVRADYLCASYGFDNYNEYSVRPVITLSSSVTVTNEQAGGKTPEIAWRFIEKI